MNEMNGEKIGELLDSVTDRLPKFINGLIGTLYSAEAGKNFGQAVGNFYKELVEAGVPSTDALAMSMEYLNTLKVINKVMNNQ